MGTPIIIVINSYGLAKPFEEAGCMGWCITYTSYIHLQIHCEAYMYSTVYCTYIYM